MNIDESKLYFCDTETSGLKPYQNALCSFTISKYNSKWSETMFFYPQKSWYSIEAFDVNGLTIPELYSKGVSRNKLIDLFTDLAEMDNLKQNYMIICGWNIEFDVGFLNAVFKEKNKKLPLPIVTFDLMAVSKSHIPKKTIKSPVGVENYKLTTIYQFYFDDYDESKAHTCEYDVMMCEKIYDKFKELGFINII
jgi:DNA polymerase III epsilon subunit-like protein